MNSFNPKNGRVIVELDHVYNDTVEVAGIKLQLDTAFRKMFNTNQKVTIVASDSDNLKCGDTAYVHHFVSEEERKIPVKNKDYRWLEYNQIYCIMREGKLKALGNFILIEPVKYDEANFKRTNDSGLIVSSKSGNDDIDRFGIVKYIGENAESKGIKVGDKVFFNKNCEYEINIENERLYRMELMDVISVVGDDVEFVV